jgi:pilus assembly protein FimV
MKWSLILIRAMLFAVLSFSVVVAANAQGTQIQGPRDAADVYSGVVYGPIDQSDTLWAISNQYRKNQQFTVYQVMMAIYELNPRAFVNRNFNTMVNGSMLQLPTDRYIARVDPQRARAKAERDDLAFSKLTGRSGASNNESSPAESETENLKSETPLVNKKELDEAQQQFQQQINSLKRQQSSLVNDFKQQLTESIQATQAIVDDNKLVLEELAKKDQEFIALRAELSEDFQAKLDLQDIQIQELREFVALAKMKEQEREASSLINIIKDPVFIISATTVGFLLVFILIALVLLRKPATAADSIEVEGEDSDHIELDDPSSNDADELLAMLETEDVTDDELLDDILSDELEESIDEIAVDTDDFGDIDDEMLVPDQTDAKANDDLSDALSELDNDDISLDGDELDSDLEGIDLDDDDIDLDGDSDSIDLDSDSDMESKADLDDEPQEVDIDSILDEQKLDIDQVEADASKELNESDSASEGDSDAQINNADDDEQTEISIDDLLEQNSLDSDVPAGVAMTPADEIDEDIIEQIGAEISEKNIEINTLTNRR